MWRSFSTITRSATTPSQHAREVERPVGRIGQHEVEVARRLHTGSVARTKTASPLEPQRLEVGLGRGQARPGRCRRSRPSPRRATAPRCPSRPNRSRGRRRPGRRVPRDSRASRRSPRARSRSSGARVDGSFAFSGRPRATPPITRTLSRYVLGLEQVGGFVVIDEQS